MKKLYLLALLGLTCLLSACGSTASCDSSSTLDTIKKMFHDFYANTKEGQKFSEGLTVIDDIQFENIFTFAKGEKGGITTCSADATFTAPDGEGQKISFEYGINHYESGDEVFIDNGLKLKIANAVYIPLAKAAAKAEEDHYNEVAAAFQAQNICQQQSPKDKLLYALKINESLEFDGVKMVNSPLFSNIEKAALVGPTGDGYSNIQTTEVKWEKISTGDVVYKPQCTVVLHGVLPDGQAVAPMTVNYDFGGAMKQGETAVNYWNVGGASWGSGDNYAVSEKIRGLIAPFAQTAQQ